MTLGEEYKQLELIRTAINNYRQASLREDVVKYEDEDDKKVVKEIIRIEVTRCDDILKRIDKREDKIKEYYSQNAKGIKRSSKKAIKLADIKKK